MNGFSLNVKVSLTILRLPKLKPQLVFLSLKTVFIIRGTSFFYSECRFLSYVISQRELMQRMLKFFSSLCKTSCFSHPFGRKARRLIFIWLLYSSFSKPVWNFNHSQWKPEESTISSQQQMMSWASERMIYWRSVHGEMMKVVYVSS